MATAVPVKTLQADLLAHQHVAANTVVTSSVFDFSGKISGAVLCRFGRRSASSGAASAYIRIEASNAASGDNSWFPVAVVPTDFAACEGEAVSGTVASGQAVITVASTTNLAAGDVIYIANNTAATSEFACIKSIVSNTSVIVEGNLVNAATGATIYDSANIFQPIIIDTPYRRIRAVFDGAQFTQACAVQVSLLTVDSFTIS